jgi:hypothetical protein
LNENELVSEDGCDSRPNLLSNGDHV